MRKVLSFMLALALVACQSVQQNPILTIEGGQIQGVDTDIAGVVVYRGIPYAAPPIKDLRWKAPQPVVPWDGVKVCDEFGHPGYQSVHYPGGYTTEWGYGAEAPYSEDCLYLNVWTKESGNPDAKLPVALWIHGGGYREGWGSEPEFDGQEWAAKDTERSFMDIILSPPSLFYKPLCSGGRAGTMAMKPRRVRKVAVCVHKCKLT